MKRSHLLNLIILPTITSAAAPPASCTSDEQCSVTQRSKAPSQSSTDVGLCGCYATSSSDPFDECEGNNASCAQAKCIADACAGLTSSCSNSGLCILELDEAAATLSTAAVVDCSVLSTCSECLWNEGCAHWTVDECHASCVVADASCYTNSGGFTGMTIDEICTKADDDRKDSALCGNMTDCISCVEAVKSDDKTCMWFEDGYCDTGCNMSGCGSTDATICSGGSTLSTQATISGGSVDATTTQATVSVSQATIPADFTTTTTSTSSTALVRNDPVSSGNTYSLFFVCVYSTTFVAFFFLEISIRR
mmetsp:Transcript_1802/g.2507  ORF Transcript_1802/g.2507 Transcript_1802/m.2507 type:complete len:307 (-) Transcript_1802:91-1011(-)